MENEESEVELDDEMEDLHPEENNLSKKKPGATRGIFELDTLVHFTSITEN